MSNETTIGQRLTLVLLTAVLMLTMTTSVRSEEKKEIAAFSAGSIEMPIRVEIDIPEIKSVEPVIEDKQTVEEKIEEVEELMIPYYDVPLDEDLQKHIFELCEERGIDPGIIIAMIERESTFNPGAIGDSGSSLGLMQIQPQWHEARMAEYDCWDLLDPYQNVTIGIDILADAIDKGRGLEWALMAYNGGGSYANANIEAGIISDYASSVIWNASNYPMK